MSGKAEERTLGRLLAALARPGARLQRDGSGRVEVVVPGSAAPLHVGPETLAVAAASRGLVTHEGEGGELTEAGRAFLRRGEAPEEAYRTQHLELRRTAGPDGAGPLVVDNESPLAWLRRRRDKDGRPLIGDAQFMAGERLRADYTRAGLMPRLGVDLGQPPMPRGQAGAGNRVADAMDGAIAARERVERAIRAMGRELGSLLVDVCCELVGLEDAERRRNWPRRSAKVVLGIGLDRLAEHYGLSDAAHGPDRSGRLRHWGAEGYRPGAGE